jgi:hypothetical protein
MPKAVSEVIESLRRNLAGSLITPEDPKYDDARKTWNADIDRRPAAIVQCNSAQDVAAALDLAQAAGLEIAVRGGAHSFPGYSVCDDGLVVDLSRMNGLIVDSDNSMPSRQWGSRRPPRRSYQSSTNTRLASHSCSLASATPPNTRKS